MSDGLVILPGFLSPGAQRDLLAEVRAVIAAAPLYVPRMPRTGKPMSVRMTNCGSLGWYTDQRDGYRYIDRHPETGRPWPALPQTLRTLWNEITGYGHPAEACLINYYAPDARMGMHLDADEEAADAPILSISLGDSCRFRVGGTKRSDPTRSVRLDSGAIVVLGGAARHCYHGVDRILGGSSTLLAEGGRLNLTLRRVK